MHTSSWKKIVIVSVLGIVTLSLLDGSASAASYYWDVNGTTSGIGGAGTWNTSGLNWSTTNSGTATTVAWPGSGNDAYFTGTTGTVTVSSVTANTISLNAGYTLSSGTITASRIDFSNAGAGTNTVNSVIAGSGLTLCGRYASTAILNLNGNNTYTGGTTITGNTGHIVLGNANALGNGNNLSVATYSSSYNSFVDLNGYSINIGNLTTDAYTYIENNKSSSTTTLNINQAGNTTSSGVIRNNAGTGGTLAITKTGAGTLTLSNTNSSFSGGLTINAGTVTVGAKNDGSNTTHNSSLGRMTPSNTIIINSGTLTSTVATNWLDNISNLADGSDSHTVVINASGKIAAYNGNSVTAIGNLTMNGGTLECNSAYGGYNYTYALLGNVTVGGGVTSYITKRSSTSASANLGLQTTTTINVAASSTLNCAAGLYGGTLTKNGAGVMYLTGTTLSVGTVTVNAGTLELSNTSGTYTWGGGNFNINSASTLKISSTNGGNQYVVGARTFTFDAAGGGTVSSTSVNFYGTNLTFITNGGAQDTVSTLGTASNAGINANNSPLTLNVAQGTDTDADLVVGRIWNGGVLNKTGLGTAKLTYANDFTGSTTISAGTLKFGIANALASSSSINVASGAVLDVNGYTSSIKELLGGGTITNSGVAASLTISNTGSPTFSGVIKDGAAALALTKTGAGTLVLTGSNSYTGGTTISAGRLLFADGSLGTTGNITMNGGTLQWASGNTQDISSRLVMVNSKTASFDTNGNTATLGSGFGGGTSGALLKTGAGTLTLAGANTYTGLTTVSGGTLQIGNAYALVNSASITIASGGTLDVHGYSTTIKNLTGSGTIDNLSGSGTYSLLVSGSSDSTFSGVIKNTTGTLTLSRSSFATGSSLTLTGNNTYTGETFILFGTLQVGNGGTTGTLGTGGVTNNGTLVFNRSDSFTVSNNISGSGSLTKTGSGTLTLSGSNSYTGATTISGGTLQVGSGGTTGSVASDIVNNASLVFNRSDIYTYAGTISGTGSVQISGIGGTVTLTGTNLFTGNVNLNLSNTVAAAKLIVTNSGALGVGPKTVTSSGGSEIHLQNNILIANNINFNTTGNALWNDSGNNTINGNITMTSGDGNTYITSTVGTLTINGNLTASTTSRGLNTLGGGNIVFNGVISNGATAALPVTISNPGGTVTIAGANTYTGATTVQEGTLQVLGSLANNGSDKVFIAAGDLSANGPTLVRRVAAGGSFAGLGSAIVDDLGTRADFIGGVASGTRNVSMAWRTRAVDESDNNPLSAHHAVMPADAYNLISDVVQLGGMGGDSLMLKLTYAEGQIVGHFTEEYLAGSNPLHTQYIYLAELVNGQWQRVGGSQSVDTANNWVMGLVTHDGIYAVVPEPGTMALLALGGVALLRRRRLK